LHWLYKLAVTEEQKRRLNQWGGWQVVECLQGPNHELCLIHSNSFGIYQIGVQATGADFTDLGQHREKRPGFAGPEDLKFFDQVVTKIQQWLSQYGKLYVSSNSSEKLGKYRTILSGLGFQISDTDVGGQPTLVIE